MLGVSIAMIISEFAFYYTTS